MVGPILTKHSEMVPTEQTFSACASNFQIFSKLNGLVNVTIAVTKVCGLGISKMDTKAFGRAIGNPFSSMYHELSSNTQSNCLVKIEKTIVCEYSFRAEAGDDDLIDICQSS